MYDHERLTKTVETFYVLFIERERDKREIIIHQMLSDWSESPNSSCSQYKCVGSHKSLHILWDTSFSTSYLKVCA